ncbi:GlcNac transferase [Thraustotheca clavata]|uniref:GlcNac transferase n=1 Tax=Thraustotheca clavata TaxID=74557 RepID=A0A1V9Z1M4_9STRA|nr:GlcNac transferase [Thraustotheca clavata]
MSSEPTHMTYGVKGVNFYAEYDQRVQHVPLHADYAHLRPPLPRLTDERDIFIGVASYRDGVKCGFTLWSAFARATYPEKVFFGIVDQTFEGDPICIEEYCKLAKQSWPEEECKYKNQVRIDARSAKTSKGPTLSRSQQYPLLEEEEFCMMIDSHSQFIYKWDELVIEEWRRTENEMAVLSNYPMGFNGMGENFTINSNFAPHICNYMSRYSNDEIARYSGLAFAYNFDKPLLSVSWAGGFSFGKCHSWKRAPIDPYMNWVFWGEEFLHAYQLWTRGYDLYSPSRHGAVVFHNWTNDAKPKPRFWDNVTVVTTQEQHDREEAMSYNRLKLMFRLPFNGEVDSREIDKYGGGKVRSLEQFLTFVNISNTDYNKDFAACNQVHFVPYQDSTELEELLPGWQFLDSHLQSKNGAVMNETQLQNLEKKLNHVQNDNTNLLSALRDVKIEQNQMIKLMNEAKEEMRVKEDAMIAEVQNVLNIAIVQNSRAMKSINARMRQMQDHSTFNEYFQLVPILILIIGTAIATYFGRRCRSNESIPERTSTKIETI